MAAADQFDDARASIRQHMAEHKIPAMSFAVWKDGRILWEEGFGMADVENRVPATKDTMFCLASLSKTLTATGLMTLVQAGKIDLDRPANDYLGKDTMTSFIGDPKAATVRTLANHTSGLPGSDQFFYGDDAVNLPPMSETIQRYGILVAPAGERHRYTNIGYGILGHMMSKVSGKSYADFMREDVFLPLGMTHSAVDVPAGMEKLQAIRYDFDRKPIPFYVSAEPASASIYASAHDLARFGMFFLKNRLPGQKRILSDASMDAMTRDPILETGTPHKAGPDGDGYALGWIVEHMGGYRTVGHSGGTSGVSSLFTLVPSENLGVIQLGNADGAVSGALTEKILKTLLPKWQEPVAEAKAPAKAPFKPTPSLAGTWQGKIHTYEGEQPIKLKVMPSGDVHVRIGGEPRFAQRSTLLQEALVNNVTFIDGELKGSTLARIETSDTQRTNRPHTVSLSLKQRGNVLNGSLGATVVYDGFWRSGLPHWTELKKVSDQIVDDGKNG